MHLEYVQWVKIADQRKKKNADPTKPDKHVHCHWLAPVGPV